MEFFERILRSLLRFRNEHVVILTFQQIIDSAFILAKQIIDYHRRAVSTALRHLYSLPTVPQRSHDAHFGNL